MSWVTCSAWGMAAGCQTSPIGTHTNCKPNYLSIMSYTFQFCSGDPDRPMDYSARNS